MAVGKAYARGCVIGLAVVAVAPLWLPVWVERRLGRAGWFVGCSEFLSLFPGQPGIWLRRAFYVMTLDGCGPDVHFGFGTTLAHPSVRIGRGVYVGNRCTLGRCLIDDHATIGSNVDVLSGRRQHNFSDPNTPVQHQGGQYTMIRLGANCWVGNSSVVMADVGAGTVIGAGAVVVHPIQSGATAVGNPATVKRLRAVA